VHRPSTLDERQHDALTSLVGCGVQERLDDAADRHARVLSDWFVSASAVPPLALPLLPPHCRVSRVHQGLPDHQLGIN
jgi:hypothetical protein